jgi:hypothetical protein
VHVCGSVCLLACLSACLSACLAVGFRYSVVMRVLDKWDVFANKPPYRKVLSLSMRDTELAADRLKTKELRWLAAKALLSDQRALAVPRVREFAAKTGMNALDAWRLLARVQPSPRACIA